ncbi:MAG: response regulator [Myxococcales bacterium]|nr:response regulator [Myxococcales bacterium]
MVDDAAEALSLLSTCSYDVVFCDMMMPGMTGDVLFTSAKKLVPSIGKEVHLHHGRSVFPRDRDAPTLVRRSGCDEAHRVQ